MLKIFTTGLNNPVLWDQALVYIQNNAGSWIKALAGLFGNALSNGTITASDINNAGSSSKPTGTTTATATAAPKAATPAAAGAAAKSCYPASTGAAVASKLLPLVPVLVLQVTMLT